VNCCVAAVATVTLVGATVTLTEGAATCTVTDAIPLAEASAALTARTVTVAGLGTEAGAV